MLKNLSILVTSRCNLKCRHCLRGFPAKRHDFPLHLLDGLLTEASLFDLSQIGLTGGEPCMHPQFEQVIEKIVEHGYKWHFTSNGQDTNIYLPIMRATRNQFGHVMVSIDGANAEIHDYIRNKQGAFKQVLEAIRLYTAEGFFTQGNIVLNKKNKEQLEEFILLGEKLELKRLVFGAIIPNERNQDLLLSEDESLKLYQKIIALRDRGKIMVHTSSALHTRGGVNFCNTLNMKKICFNEFGEMIFCWDTNHPKSIVGSLDQYSLKTLLDMWLEKSTQLQKKRLEIITTGKTWEGFDTCAFCNHIESFSDIDSKGYVHAKAPMAKQIKQKAIGYCGPASLQMLLSAIDIDLSQESIMGLLNIPEEKRVDGTRIDQLAQIVENHVNGYILLAKYNSTVFDLHLVNREYHLPAGIEWQGSFTEPDGSAYDEGHYSVVLDTDINLSRLIIIDPDERGSFKNGILPFTQLEKRWWDVNRLPYGNNGSIKMLDTYNEGLAFIIVPRNDTNKFTKYGFQPATLELIKNYQRKPEQSRQGRR